MIVQQIGRQGFVPLDWTVIRVDKVRTGDMALIWGDRMSALDEVVDARRRRIQTPIICVVPVTTTPTEAGRILMSGADDLVRANVDPRELVARIEAVRRRTDRAKNANRNRLEFGPITIDLDGRRMLVNGRHTHLTGKQFDTLETIALASKHGNIATRRLIMNSIYVHGDEVDAKIVDVYICKIRAQIRAAGGNPKHLQSEWGRGYSLVETPASEAKPGDRPATHEALLATMRRDRWMTVGELSRASGVGHSYIYKIAAKLVGTGEATQRLESPLAYKLTSNVKLEGEAA
jgi:two-component system cell cycle response regulator CtrA